MDQDVLYIADRHKKEFTYPIHNHDVFELNFVENAAGVRRIVGDNSEIISDLDLVLITSPNLEHVWEQYHCQSKDIHEITVQFKFDLDNGFLKKNPLMPLRQMLKRAQKGLAFHWHAIAQVYSRLIHLSSISDRFEAVIQFMSILNTLAQSEEAHTLASTSHAHVELDDESRRIIKVKGYIAEHYMDELRLADIAAMVNMSQSAFSRFFKLHTGRTLSEYIIDVRMSNAIRMLVNTTETISNICYDCGYNNLSNFNRHFLHKNDCTPKEYRERYRKIKVLI